MPFELNNGQGFLFHNRNKEEGDNLPGLTGECLIDGVVYDLAIWKKVSKKGNTWYSASIKPKQDEPPPPKKEPKQQEFDDDLPF